MQDLTSEGVNISTASLQPNLAYFLNPEKSKWYVEVQYRNFNLMDSIMVATPNIIEIIDSFQLATSEYFCWLYIWPMYSLRAYFNSLLAAVAFISKGTKYIFPRLPLGYLHSLAMIHKLCRKDFASVFLQEYR